MDVPAIFLNPDDMKDMDEAMQQWVSLHYNDDPTRLRLRFHGNPEAAQAIMQIECRHKAAARLPETLSERAFMFPSSLSAEQATSEPIARLHADIAGITSGLRHLDLTCGLGIDTFEAARRGADVTAIDIDPIVAATGNHNAMALHLRDNIRVLNADSASFINETDQSWDTIFIDPARRGDSGQKLTAIASCSPDVTSMLPRLLTLSPKIIIKASPMLDIAALAAELNASTGGRGYVSRIITVGTARECKETVAIVERGSGRDYAVEAVTVLPDNEERIWFRTSKATAPQSPAVASICGLPAPGEYLYEPFPAVMKTADWRGLASLGSGLKQLHPNTHLFVSPTPVGSFPGIQFVIERVETMSDRSLRMLSKEYPKINVSTRNFIISAPELARRLRIKEGGLLRLYGVRCGEKATLAVVVCRPV